ncbi:MAG: DNA repair protein RadC [Clostridia bacterium]|nr:DNA repair protein RadC [Clostridia bacterium]
MHNGHRERMREKFETHGAEIFEDHEILEMLLFFPIARKNTNELAHSLINRFGSLSGVFDADGKELREVDGVGAGTAFFIKLVAAAMSRYTSPKTDKRIRLDSYERVCNYLDELFAGAREEKIYAICMNNSFRVISCEKIAIGSTGAVETKVKKILQSVVKNNSALAIIAHNHPDGVAIPSGEDIDCTMRLCEIFKYFDCKMIDHFVVANGHCTPILNGNNADFEALYAEKVRRLKEN